MKLNPNVEPSNKCPYCILDSEDGWFTCTLGDWGKDRSGQVKHTPLSRDVVLNCLCEKHFECPTFRRHKIKEAKK